ncbi:MAG: hypothetical protein ACK5JN_09285 [Kluyvera sp.]|uniref:hypothetical protein n=1 Tax=Kluyvera sp. TaxID=1538228 RepID=UPI003A8B22EE
MAKKQPFEHSIAAEGNLRGSSREDVSGYFPASLRSAGLPQIAGPVIVARTKRFSADSGMVPRD